MTDRMIDLTLFAMMAVMVIIAVLAATHGIR